MARAARRLALTATALLALGCGPRVAPPAAESRGPAVERARPDMEAMLRQDLAAVRHPADGGGRAWLDPTASDLEVGASEPGRWTIVYEAGPLGVAVGGAVFLQVSPFWGWSTPQVGAPDAPGYTVVSSEGATSDGPAVRLIPRTLDQQLLAIEIDDRPLAAGERIRIVYGAGDGPARADRFAERGSRLWIAVDGDGDGVRAVLPGSPGVDVRAGPPARLLAFLPATARPGDTVRLTVAVVDGRGNAGPAFDGVVRLDLPAGLAGPSEVALRAADGARAVVPVVVEAEGVYRVGATADGEETLDDEALAAEAGPMQVATAAARILWGDLQVHTGLSDGTGRPDDVLAYARDVAALDVVALTDHDHWGMRFLDASPDLWQEILAANQRFEAPGRFVTVPGYEWTSWIVGHRHVLFFDPADARVLSSIDPAFDTPAELWAALRGRRVLTVTHHTAGGPIGADWTIAPDPELEPLTEIASVHGSSEAPDAPTPIYRPIAGNWVRDALARGHRLGFLGSSDGHDGHPGLGELASPSSGLAAILAEELTRDAVYEALRARRVYATNGARIVLRVAYAGYRMGATVPLVAAAGGWEVKPPVDPLPGVPPRALVVQALAPGAIASLDVIHPGGVETTACHDEPGCNLTAELGGRLQPGDWLYVRVVQQDGGAAWSSPFFFEAAP